MKMLTLVCALMFTQAAVAQQALDPANSKLRIYWVAQPTRDCKLSLKEIAKFDGHTVGERYLCAQLVDVNTEISLTQFADLLREKKIAVNYAGAQAVSLLQTLNAWRDALVKDEPTLERTLNHVKPWAYAIEKQTADETTIRMTNSKTDASLTFVVRMKQPVPKN